MIIRKYLNNLIYIIFFSIVIFICIYLYCNKLNSHIIYDDIKSTASSLSDNKFYFFLQDGFDEDGNLTFSDFFKQEDSLDRLYSFNKTLHSKYDYIEVVYQPIEYIGEYFYNLDFVNGYLDSEKSVDLSNQKVKINNKYEYITPLNTVQLDYEAYNYFNLKINEGRDFQKSDFYISQEIPIILGKNYSGLYKIGDSIEFYYLGVRIKAKVIGILPQDNNINKIKNISFDNYIIMPFLEITNINFLNNSQFTNSYDNEIENFFFKLLYTQKNNGIFISDSLDDYENLKYDIKNISDKLNMDYSIVNYYAK